MIINNRNFNCGHWWLPWNNIVSTLFLNLETNLEPINSQYKSLFEWSLSKLSLPWTTSFSPIFFKTIEKYFFQYQKNIKKIVCNFCIECERISVHKLPARRSLWRQVSESSISPTLSMLKYFRCTACCQIYGWVRLSFADAIIDI